MVKPPCANWRLWSGEEIEGFSRGTPTLFLRSLPPSFRNHPRDLTFNGEFRRIWVCKEFREWEYVRLLFDIFDEVVIETTPAMLPLMPIDVFNKARLYLKVDLGDAWLKPQDVVCVGPAFADEAFQIGTGVKVSPGEYHEDHFLY